MVNLLLLSALLPGSCDSTANLRCGSSNYALKGGPRCQFSRLTMSSSGSGICYDALERDMISTLRNRIGREQLFREVPVDEAYSSAVGYIGGSGSGSGSNGSRDSSRAVQFTVKAFRSQQFKYIRSAKFISADKSFNVLNFVIAPDLGYNYNMPVFGVDLVVLPGAAVVAVDFQPVEDKDDAASLREYYGSNPFYAALSAMPHHKEALESARGRLPVDAVPASVSRYFSPYSAYCRMRLADMDEAAIGACVMQYLRLYVDIVESLGVCGDANSDVARVRVSKKTGALNEYMTYRNVNDPAKRLLQGCFGPVWTQGLLDTVLFPLQ